MFEAEDAKISRYLGSFYDLKLPDRSMDVILLSQAFHHADRPLQLLTECDRILKQGGRILLIGEPRITKLEIARRFLGTMLRHRRVVSNFYELFPPDPVLGDHYYRQSEYYFMFRAMGYRVKHVILGSGNIAYIADKI